MSDAHINQRETPPCSGLMQDPRCSVAAFAAANPSLCPNSNVFVLKPAQATVCVGGQIQFYCFIAGTTEQIVSTGLTYTSSNPSVVSVNAGTGLASIVAAGTATVSVTDGTNTGFALINVLATGSCPDIQVETVIALDNSLSMGDAFSSYFPTKLSVAKPIVWAMIDALESKDLATLIQFSDAPYTKEVATNVVQTLHDGLHTVGLTNKRTNIAAAFRASLESFSTNPETQKVVVLVSDGMQRPWLSLTESADLIDMATHFKAAGGIVVCVGLRAYSDGWVLLRSLASGGYFINIVPATTIASAVSYVTALMGYYCAGSPVFPGYGSVPQIPDVTPSADSEAAFV